jgi:hypothetical protein
VNLVCGFQLLLTRAAKTTEMKTRKRKKRPVRLLSKIIL